MMMFEGFEKNFILFILFKNNFFKRLSVFIYYIYKKDYEEEKKNIT